MATNFNKYVTTTLHEHVYFEPLDDLLPDSDSKKPSALEREVQALKAQLKDYEHHVETLCKQIEGSIEISYVHATLSKYLRVNENSYKLPKNKNVITEFLKALAFDQKSGVPDELCD